VPLPRDVLDLLLVPTDPALLPDPAAIERLFDRWQERGLLAPGTGPLRRTAGPRAWGLLPGGFGTLWLDRPPGEVLYANQQGGFRVLCPDCGANLVPAFQAAVRARREGRSERVRCACGLDEDVVRLPLLPPGAFARGALILGDVQGLDPVPGALVEVEGILGSVRVLARRRA